MIHTTATTAVFKDVSATASSQVLAFASLSGAAITRAACITACNADVTALGTPHAFCQIKSSFTLGAPVFECKLYATLTGASNDAWYDLRTPAAVGGTLPSSDMYETITYKLGV